MVFSALVPVRMTRASDLDEAIRLVLRMNEAAAQSQQRVDKLDNEKSDLLSRYRTVQQQLEALKEYNQQVSNLVAAQNEQAAKLQKQIDDATFISRGVTPLMVKMIDSLEKFVNLDVPFLIKERKSRVERLKKLMGRPDVTEAEKYRLITEAYQIENDYGRTIEAYQGQLPTTDGSEGPDVEFLRIGRVSLVYRTRDGAKIGSWDQNARQWVDLPAEYTASVRDGFRIARKQAAPNLFRVPVSAPTEASQ
ncbi:MAG: DUF3450 domain-containing protein [Myxococcota bacterium]